MKKYLKIFNKLFPYIICLVFFSAYSVLAIVRFNHYGAFGFDLGLEDQRLWQYSHFKAPLTTIHFYPFTSILSDHVEFFYIPLSVFYWIWSSPKFLLLIQALFVCFSGIAVFLLAKEKKLNIFISYALLFSYLTFYGVQNALWFDVHSASFGAAFIAWLLYFLEKKKIKWAVAAFILAISAKENFALLTFFIFLVFFIRTKNKIYLYLLGASLVYIFLVFGIYFPYFTENGYRFKNEGGLLSNAFNYSSFYDTEEKRSVLFYSFAWFGFIPILNPIFLLPALSDLWNYFVVASGLKAAQGLFMHYRITLAPLMVWATIITISRYKWLNKRYLGAYIILAAMFFQYTLHLPLSYLSKQWFWKEPQGAKNINEIIKYLPKKASVVSQNNITPHISQRENIFTFWPEKRTFKVNSPCGNTDCDWFRWAGNPEYLIVDTSAEWDVRHLLTNREDYIKGLQNLEKKNVIVKYKESGNAVLYKIIKNPASSL